jgi:23S rRNA (guanosine2251-2'-O)-methyltransferase
VNGRGRDRDRRRPDDSGRGPRPEARSPAGPGAERVVYGANPVREVLARRPGDIKAIWVDPRRADRQTSDPVAAIVGAARTAGIPLEDRPRGDLDRAAGEGAVHQGVVAWLGEFHYAELDEILRDTDGPPLVVLLDGIEDPRNLGAIIRSAYLLGAHGIVIPEHRAAQVTALVGKTSAGASELLPIVQANLARALDELRERGLWRVAVHAVAESQPIAALDLAMPLCLVLGAEGAGVRPLVAKNCDFHAVIPMARDAVGSFNVSVAASLALYEVARQRARSTAPTR